eukprot:4036901-Ditylum_brightwellii.AAC.1
MAKDIVSLLYREVDTATNVAIANARLLTSYFTRSTSASSMHLPPIYKPLHDGIGNDCSINMAVQ